MPQRKRNNLLGSVYEDLLAIDGGLADERRANNVFPVLGEGSDTAKIIFVGEAPGKNEAARGRPFCGASGKFLDVLLTSIGMSRESVYITNIVKDRPTDNRDPSTEEIALYAPLLDRQIDIIRPRVIATLGRISMAYIMKKFELEHELQVISKVHGKVFKVKAPWGGELAIIPLYHPAVALYNGGNRSLLLDDFKVLKGVL